MSRFMARKYIRITVRGDDVLLFRKRERHNFVNFEEERSEGKRNTTRRKVARLLPRANGDRSECL